MPSNHRNSMAGITGASSREGNAERARVLDGYSTPRVATLELMRRERLERTIWEPAAGLHAISDVMRNRGHRVFTSDVFRWDPRTRVQRSFMSFDRVPFSGPVSLVTNPPFRLAQEFVEHANAVLPRGSKICLLLRLQFLEGNKRGLMFQRIPPRRILVFSFRLPRMHRFHHSGATSGNMMSFAWYVWTVGYDGPTVTRWIPRPEYLSRGKRSRT